MTIIGMDCVLLCLIVTYCVLYNLFITKCYYADIF